MGRKPRKSTASSETPTTPAATTRADARARQDRGADDAARAGRVPHRKKGACGRVEEVEAMRGSVSPSTHRRYPLTMICGLWRRARSSVYLALAPPRPAGPPAKRGPKTRVRDAELVTEIRAVLAASPFPGEGYRKIRARLAHRGVAVSGKRVLRLLRQHGLLAPPSVGPGTIRRAAEGPRRVISRK